VWGSSRTTGIKNISLPFSHVAKKHRNSLKDRREQRKQTAAVMILVILKMRPVRGEGRLGLVEEEDLYEMVV